MGIFSSPKIAKSVDPLSLAKGQSEQLLGYYGSQVPNWLQLQGNLGPQIMGQMFNQTGQFLGGVNGQPGLQALQLSTGQQSGKTLGQLRAEELAQMTGQSGLTRSLMQAMSPEQASAIQQAQQESQRAYASSQGVTPQEQRMYQQTAREGAQAAGRLGGNYAVASEIMGREDIMANKRAQAAKAGQNVYNLASQFYTQPGLNILGQQPLSYQAGNQTLATALTAGPASSGQFDYNMPLNYANQRASALDRQNMAQFQADQQNKAQMMGLLTKGIGAIAAPFTGGLSLGLGMGGGGFDSIMSGFGKSTGQGIMGLMNGSSGSVNSNQRYMGDTSGLGY